MQRTQRQAWDKDSRLRWAQTTTAAGASDKDGRTDCFCCIGQNNSETSTFAASSQSASNGAGELARKVFTAAHEDKTASTATAYQCVYWDGAGQSGIQVQGRADGVARWASGHSQLSHDQNGYLKSARDNAANRSLTYQTNAQGLVVERDENRAGTKFEHHWYCAGGRLAGEIATDPGETSRQSHAEQLAQLEAGGKQDKSGFKDLKPATSSGFDQNCQPINLSCPAAVAGSCVVRTGDALRSIVHPNEPLRPWP